MGPQIRAGRKLRNMKMPDMDKMGIYTENEFWKPVRINGKVKG